MNLSLSPTGEYENLTSCNKYFQLSQTIFFLTHRWELQQIDLKMLLDSWVHSNRVWNRPFQLYNSTSSFGKWEQWWLKYIPHSFHSLESSVGSSSVQQTQQAQRRELWSGNHRQCKRSPFQVGHLAQGWMNSQWVPDLPGTRGKGTKECWQWDVQRGKTVNLALGTQETQGFLHN